MSFTPSTSQQLPIMNRIALRVRYPPDYHPQEEPVRLPLGLFNDLLLELQNLSARYLPLNQEFDPTSIALELKVRDKASRSGPKEEAGKQRVESRIEDDEIRNVGSDERSNKNKVEARPGGSDPASSKKSFKTRSNKPQVDYAHAEALAQTQPSETLNPNQEAKYGQASSRTIAFQIRYLTYHQWNENAPLTVVTKEEVATDANAEKKAEFDSPLASKQPIEIESAPSIPSIPPTPSIPKEPIFPKILGAIGMSESRWAKEDVSPNSGKSRRGGLNSRHGRGGSPSGGHSPTSSQQGSVVSLPQSQEEKWNRNHGRAQDSSDWGDNSAGAGGTNGDGWGSDLIPTLPPRDEAYTWVSDPITEKPKQLKDGRGKDSIPTGKTQPQVDGNDWADTVPVEIKKKHRTKKRSYDLGARTGNDDYSHSRPIRDNRGTRGAHGDNLKYGRLNTEFDESSSGWNSPSLYKHPDENNGWDTGTSPQTKHSKSVASDDWAATGPANSSPRSPRGGGDHGDYSKGEGGGLRGRGSWNGVAQSAYNRSTEIKAGIEPEKTAPSWSDESNFAASKEGRDLNDSDAGHLDISKKSQDAESPSSSAQDPASTWDDTPGWRPSRFKKHEPNW